MFRIVVAAHVAQVYLSALGHKGLSALVIAVVTTGNSNLVEVGDSSSLYVSGQSNTITAGA